MIRVTSFVHLDDHGRSLRDDLSGALRAAVPGPARAVHVAATGARARDAGDLMVLCAFAPADAVLATTVHDRLAAAVATLAPAAHVESVWYRQGVVELAEPDLRDGVQRTLLLAVGDRADPVAVARFEVELAAMGRYIDAIRNSSLSRVDRVAGATGPPWTHVWEQEFRTLEGLTGPYMDHPYHWAVVDRWFDPESGVQIVDTRLVHAMCDLDRSILTLVPGARRPVTAP